jgi:tetratricopeptide (TPR) repeat protein
VADQDPTPLDQAADVETTSSATAAAVALALGRRSPSSAVDAEAESFLRDQRGLIDKQGRMLDLQMEGLAEDRRLQHRHLALRYFGDRLRIGLQLIGIALGVMVLFGVGGLVWAAHEDKGLVIEAFSVPPDLAQRGLTGQVVASQLLDKLSQMQADTESGRPASTYANDWGGEIKVEIPETGVSIGEAYRYLRAWLGHETHITGEVVRTATGLAITARAGASPGKTAQGADADLDKLLQQAAEGVYGQTQPYRYAAFLASQGRRDEALAAYNTLAETGDREDQLWALTGAAELLNDLGRLHEAKADIDAALRLDTRFFPARFTAATINGRLDLPEDTLASARETIRLLRDGTAEGVPSSQQSKLIPAVQRALDADLGDYRGALEILQRRTPVGHEGTAAVRNQFYEASDRALDHDVSGSRAITDGLSTADPAGGRLLLSIQAAQDRIMEDWAALDGHAQAYAAKAGPEDPSSAYRRGLALAHLGKLDEAEAILSSTPLTCPDCLVIRAFVASQRGDWAAADRWSAEAVRLAPSWPTFPSRWGDLLRAKGDLKGAITQYQLAHQNGPKWADPLEGWGEALMGEGDYAGAVAKFAEADQDAPRWGRNHMMWGEALARLGRKDEAEAQWRAAAGMDLSTTDRTTVSGLLEVR